MDIYQAIESDHELAKGLLWRISQVRNPEWRHQLCHDLWQVVHVHAKVVQIAFHDALVGYAAIRAPLAQVQEDEAYAESLLEEALGRDPESPDFMRLFEAARIELERQMVNETGEIFAFARTVLSPAQAAAIGYRMRSLKDEFIEASYMTSASLRADAGYFC